MKSQETDGLKVARVTRRLLLQSTAAGAFLASGVKLYPFTAHAAPNTHEEAGFRHLATAMDRFHGTFDVYTDESAGGNHYTPSGWMGDLDAIAMDTASTERPRGKTCIKAHFRRNGSNWAGVYWQNPRNNWGTEPDAGYDLSGASKLTFWARGADGGEKVEFFAGGLGRSTTCRALEEYPDSFCQQSTGPVELSTRWEKFQIDLSAAGDLSYVVGGFGWVASSDDNRQPVTFFIDNIRYDKTRHGERRLITSYVTTAYEEPDIALTNTAFVYDNAMAILAWLARGGDDDVRRAKLLADAMVYAQTHDRSYSDRRLRNAYQSGDIADRMTGDARLPGWWDPDTDTWLEDRFQISSCTGNLAWAILALVRVFELHGGNRYLRAAKRLGNWIHGKTRDGRGVGGYTGGFDGAEPSPEKIHWKSTEHNLAVYVAFMKLWEQTRQDRWLKRAMRAKRFVRSMWNDEEGHFWTGTTEDGRTINYDGVPSDVQSLGLMAFGESERYGEGIAWNLAASAAKEACGDGKQLKGVDFNNDPTGIWWEETARTVIALRMLGRGSPARGFLRKLRAAQERAPNSNGEGIVAACRDGDKGSIDWAYLNRLHVGTTAWYLCAERRHNPLWGIPTNEEVPYQGEYR